MTAKKRRAGCDPNDNRKKDVRAGHNEVRDVHAPTTNISVSNSLHFNGLSFSRPFCSFTQRNSLPQETIACPPCCSQQMSIDPYGRSSMSSSFPSPLCNHRSISRANMGEPRLSALCSVNIPASCVFQIFRSHCLFSQIVTFPQAFIFLPFVR